MIKQDYKPRISTKAFSNNAFATLPAWISHPFAIIGYALITLILAIILFKDDETSAEDSMIESSIDRVVEEAESVKSIQLESGSINSGPINLDLFNTNESATTASQAKIKNSHFEKQTPRKETAIPTVRPDSLIQSEKQTTPVINKGKNTKYSSPTIIPLNFSNSKNQKYALKPLISSLKWKSESVRKNDNLSLIFKRIGLTPQMVYKISTLDKNTKILSNLRPGKSIYYQLDKNNQLMSLKYVIDMQNTLYVERESFERRGADSEINKNNKLVSRMVNKTIEYRTAYISGIITDSLFLSGKRAGMSDSLVINFANIFEWDIDFILDIRAGDSFSLLYQEEFLDGEKIGNGNIIAAEVVNRGDVIRAIRYTDSKNNSDYYSDAGLSMRKAFLRAPVNFRYISDGFNPRRFHPVQKRIKPHRGIDYAAPVGTPIRASGDGKVIASGYNKFNGKYVFIQHGNSIVTKYLHLSKRLVSRGKRVKQGQIIGKLGSTGMVTGPHLHYEFVVNGVHRNPRTVSLPKAEAIPKYEKANFLIASKALVLQLENRKQIQSSQLVAK
ncbi:MAG: peptidase M23 [Gammaproteobacteria bacterium]|nr:MAG: peptidase M23 [Gammaproteobacteria bacterium]